MVTFRHNKSPRRKPGDSGHAHHPACHTRLPSHVFEGDAALFHSVDDLRGRLGELSKDRQILAYCQVGMRGSIATRILLQKGFDAANLGGGYKTFLLLRAARGS